MFGINKKNKSETGLKSVNLHLLLTLFFLSKYKLLNFQLKKINYLETELMKILDETKSLKREEKKLHK